jgi:hypothetical protein
MMGGTLTVVIRKPGGEVFVMQRWTNPAPYYIVNMKLVNEDMAFIDEYISKWVNRKKEDGDPPGNDGFFPTEYGIVIVDMVNKVIVDCQDYFGYNVNSMVGDVDDDDRDFEVDRFAAFARAGNIVEYKAWEDWHDASGELHSRCVVKKMSDLGSVDDAIKAYAGRKLFAFFKVDMKPYTVERYKDLAAEKKRIAELGFVLTPDDESGWEKRMADA